MMHSIFHFKGKEVVVDPPEILSLAVHALRGGAFSQAERHRLAELIEPMQNRITRMLMAKMEKYDEEGLGEKKSLNEGFDQMLLCKTVHSPNLPGMMAALRCEEGIDLQLILGRTEPGYKKFTLAGPIHCLYDYSEIVRVRAVLLGERDLPSRIVGQA